MNDHYAICYQRLRNAYALGRKIFFISTVAFLSITATGIGWAQTNSTSASRNPSEATRNNATALPEWFGPTASPSGEIQHRIQTIEQAFDTEDVDYGRNIEPPDPSDLAIPGTNFTSYSALNPCLIPGTERSFGIFEDRPRFLPGGISRKLGKSNEELDEYSVELAKYYISFSMDEEAHLALSQIEAVSTEVQILREIARVISSEALQFQSSLSEFSGCESPMAFWSFLAMSPHTLAPVFDPDVIIATFEKQSSFLRRSLVQRLVQRFIQLGDRESALIIRDQMRFEGDETDILPLLLDLQMGENFDLTSMPDFISRLETGPRLEAIALIEHLLSEGGGPMVSNEELYSIAFHFALVGRSSQVSQELVAQTISSRLNASQLHGAMAQLKQAVSLQLIEDETLIEIIQQVLDPIFETSGCVYILSDWMWERVIQFGSELRWLSASRLLDCGLTKNVPELYTGQQGAGEVHPFEAKIASLEYDAGQLGILMVNQSASLPDTELAQAARRAEMYDFSTRVFQSMGDDQNYLEDLWRAGILEEYVAARSQKESWMENIFSERHTFRNETVTTSLVQTALKDSEDLRLSVEIMIQSFAD